MRSNTWVAALCFVACLTILGPEPARSAEAPKHHFWEHVFYPRIQLFSDELPPTSFVLNRYPFHFTFTLNLLLSDEQARNLPSSDGVEVRLHTAEGRPIEPSNTPGFGGGTRTGGTGGSHSCTYDFPSTRNALDEGWIEFKLPDRTLWFEIPYGFTRKSGDDLPQHDGKSEEPSLATAMTTIGDRDVIVPWLSVGYDLGTLKSGVKLSLWMKNQTDARAELELYRLKGGWELNTPRTSIEILENDGSSVGSRAMSIRLHRDNMRRTDTFHFGRNPRHEGRYWGTARIKVDDETYEFIMPSSLFRYGHGIADPSHKSRLRVSTDD